MTTSHPDSNVVGGRCQVISAPFKVGRGAGYGKRMEKSANPRIVLADD